MSYTQASPHLSRWRGMWQCTGARAWACGTSIQSAYASWRNLLVWQAQQRVRIVK